MKVTLSLSKTSVDFFKKEAKKYNTQYQRMIRRLLDEYTAHQ
ncbi:Helix-turn-helix protein, CopG (fragment) [Desulfosarcina cetonica]